MSSPIYFLPSLQRFEPKRMEFSVWLGRLQYDHANMDI